MGVVNLRNCLKNERTSSIQDEFDTRREELLKVFIPFREGLLEGFEEFTREALGVGLHGVELCKRKETGKEMLEATLTLNEFDLILLSTDKVYSCQFSPGMGPPGFGHDGPLVKMTLHTKLLLTDDGGNRWELE
jgi:hypothetical protein